MLASVYDPLLNLGLLVLKFSCNQRRRLADGMPPPSLRVQWSRPSAASLQQDDCTCAPRGLKPPSS